MTPIETSRAIAAAENGGRPMSLRLALDIKAMNTSSAGPHSCMTIDANRLSDICRAVGATICWDVSSTASAAEMVKTVNATARKAPATPHGTGRRGS
jgi:hypothetical protein